MAFRLGRQEFAKPATPVYVPKAWAAQTEIVVAPPPLFEAESLSAGAGPLFEVAITLPLDELEELVASLAAAAAKRRWAGNDDDVIVHSERPVALAPRRRRFTRQAADFSATVLQQPGNAACADCGAVERLTWASTNLGVVVCGECIGGHRALGVHISKPLSLFMDDWTEDQQATFLDVGGNDAVNATLEAHEAVLRRKPEATTPRQQRVAYIRSKYVDRAFTLEGDGKVTAVERVSSAAAEQAEASQVHAGVAIVRVLRARRLRAADILTSDPYAWSQPPNNSSTL